MFSEKKHIKKQNNASSRVMDILLRLNDCKTSMNLILSFIIRTDHSLNEKIHIITNFWNIIEFRSI